MTAHRHTVRARFGRAIRAIQHDRVPAAEFWGPAAQVPTLRLVRTDETGRIPRPRNGGDR